MPRKPNQKIIKTTVVIKGTTIAVTLYPPKPPRTSWYAFWPDLVAAKSTGQTNSEDALHAVVGMLSNNGKPSKAADLVLADAEFENVQKQHFAKRTDPAAQERAAKSLRSCLEAIAAFRDISGITPVARATADDCERFQTRTLTLPKDWLTRHDLKSEAERYSSNTVLKWTRELQAAFQRANKNAGRKCIRGIVDERRLLTTNPWHQFSWIEGTERPIRQFDDVELISFLDYLETQWSGMTVATALAKTCLWSWGRKTEIMGLKWDSCRIVGGEVHFETVGKWGVEKWFRLPAGLYEELQKLRTDSPYVFAAYNEQARLFHLQCNHPTDANLVTDDFNPDNLGRWFERRLSRWSKMLPKGRASIHVFRKTSLQYARRGEDVNNQVARDARVGTAVMMRHYVKEADPERRNASNRTFYRIVASLAPETAKRYGHLIAQASREELEKALQAAVEAKDWLRVSQLSVELNNRST